MSNLKKCGECSTYTMQSSCPSCGAEASSPEPPKFSYPDTYGEYRRQTKRRMRETDTETDTE